MRPATSDIGGGNENAQDKGRRQAHPIGDEVNGQAIQNYKPLTILDTPVKWIDFETLTVSNTAKKLTRPVYDYVLITVDADAVKFTLDDTVPTATIGHTVAVNGQIILLNLAEVKAIQFIRVTTDVTLQISYGSRLQ